MTNVLAQMEADGRYNGMQLALAPWLGIDKTGTYFGDQEGSDVWALIKDKMGSGELNVMSTMINFPKEDYSTLSSITNTMGYMYGVATNASDQAEQWAANLRSTAEAAKLTKELKDCMRFGLGGRYAWNEDCTWGEGIVSRLDFGGCHTFLNVVKNDSELQGVNILYERITTDPTLMAAREKEVKLAMDRIINQMTEPEGEPCNPWSVGAERGTILAYKEGSKVVFSGHGAMRDFIGSTAPWGTGVIAAEFGPQVGTIGANAFAGCNLTELTMRGNPPTIGEGNDFGGGLRSPFAGMRSGSSRRPKGGGISKSLRPFRFLTTV